MTLPKAMRYVSTAPNVTPDTARRASLEAARHAADAPELRDFLGMLGLPGGVTTRIVTTLSCGHPSTDGHRAMGVKGVVCRTCAAEYRTGAR